MPSAAAPIRLRMRERRHEREQRDGLVRVGVRVCVIGYNNTILCVSAHRRA